MPANILCTIPFCGPGATFTNAVLLGRPSWPSLRRIVLKRPYGISRTRIKLTLPDLPQLTSLELEEWRCEKLDFASSPKLMDLVIKVCVVEFSNLEALTSLTRLKWHVRSMERREAVGLGDAVGHMPALHDVSVHWPCSPAITGDAWTALHDNLCQLHKLRTLLVDLRCELGCYNGVALAVPAIARTVACEGLTSFTVTAVTIQEQEPRARAAAVAALSRTLASRRNPLSALSLWGTAV
jgi:hypothetical protein